VCGSIALLCCSGGLAIAPAGAAGCVEPALTQRVLENVEAGEAAGGGVQVIAVSGRGFGDDCHDTGSPPEGEGVLGTPIAGLALLVIADDQRVVVAEGSADASYGFDVTVRVPHALLAGSARLSVEAEGLLLASGPTLGTIQGPVADRPIAPPTTVRFGPDRGAAAPSLSEVPESNSTGQSSMSDDDPPARTQDGSDANDGVGRGWLAPAIVGGLFVVVAGVATTVRRRS